MKPVPAIVESSFDFEQTTRAIIKEHIALQDDERNADTHERKSESFRKSAARRRVELGRLLIEAKRGIKHGGWLPYLEKLGIEQQRASEWMRLAGHVEAQAKSPTFSNDGSLPAPTLAEAGIDKRPRKSAPRDEQPDPPEDDEDDDARAVEASLLTMVASSLGTVARRWPGDIKRLADELRRFADKLERRIKE